MYSRRCSPKPAYETAYRCHLRVTLYHNFLKVDSRGTLNFEHHSAKVFVSKIKGDRSSEPMFTKSKCNRLLANLITKGIEQPEHSIWSRFKINLDAWRPIMSGLIISKRSEWSSLKSQPEHFRDEKDDIHCKIISARFSKYIMVNWVGHWSDCRDDAKFVYNIIGVSLNAGPSLEGLILSTAAGAGSSSSADIFLASEALIPLSCQDGRDEKASIGVSLFFLIIALGISPFTRDDTSRPRLLPNFNIADITLSARTGMTPLHLACIVGSIAIVTDLLEYIWAEKGTCADLLNARDHPGNTPLFYASCGHRYWFLARSSASIEQIIEIMLDFERKEAPSQINCDGPFVSKFLNEHNLSQLETIPSGMVMRCSDTFLEKIFTRYTPGLGYSLDCGLVRAAERGQEKVVRILIENGADVNFIHMGPTCPLSAALKSGNVRVLELLLGNGASFDSWHVRCSNSPFQLAAAYGDVNILQLLLNRGQDINAAGQGGTAFRTAASNGDYEMARFLLKNGADINSNGGWMGTALEAAVSKRDYKMARFLLENGADINADTEWEGTALAAAVSSGDCEMVRFLLENGADRNIHGGLSTVLAEAASYGDCEMAQFLLEQGADINADGGENGTPLAAAALKSDMDMVIFLLEQGGNINSGGEEYGTPLVAAAAALPPQLELIKFFLEQGVDINASGRKHGTAIAVAASWDSVDIVLFLLEQGADINAKGGEWGTPLGAALYYRADDTLDLLLSRGADISCLTEENQVKLESYLGEIRIELRRVWGA